MRTTDEVVGYLRGVVQRADTGALPEAFGVFSRAYVRITQEVVGRIDANWFADSTWLADFDVRFATFYRNALENPATAPEPWRIAFDVAKTDEKKLIRHLMLGINAHMSYDLCAVLLGGFVDDPVKRKPDFDRVNDVMRAAIDPIQRVLEDRYAAWLAAADAAGFGIDEVLTVDLFVSWRTRAWNDAMDIYAGKLALADVEKRIAERAKIGAFTPF